VRATLGVLTPLAVGIATGRVEYGSFAALGALPAGFVAFRGVNRTRAVAILCAAVGMAFSTFAGATAARHPWLLVPLVLVWAYGTGLLAVLGPTVLAVTLQWPVALLVGSALPLSLAGAGVRAGLVLAGGLWQCLLVISSWTLSRGSAERSALAATYSELAGYASRLASGQLGPPDPSQLPASLALADPNPLLRTAARQHMLDLADEAVRIRTTLAALSVAADADGSPALAVRDLLRVAAGALTELAAELDARSGRRDDPWRPPGGNSMAPSSILAPPGGGPPRRCSASSAPPAGLSSG
jgi:hypothetical protein